MRLCVFTDASQSFWSAVVTHVPPKDLDKPLADQRREPLAFISGALKGASSRWPIVEKMAFAIVETTDRLDCFRLHPNGFSLLCDHRNLQYIFDLLTTNPGLARHLASKLFRWALMFSIFSYTIEFLPGDSNVWAELMTRCGVVPTLLARRIRGIFRAPIAPSFDSELEWPDVSAVRSAQASATCTPPIGFEARESDSIIASSSGAAWIPIDAVELQLRLCILARTGAGGHRGVASTFTALSAYFFWTTARSDTLDFVKCCIHCLATTGGSRVPRPLGEALHADKPNVVIHFDFLYVGKSSSGPIYILVLRDDMSGYVWFWPCAHADALSIVDALTTLFAAFGVCTTWVSDQGSHFKNSGWFASNSAYAPPFYTCVHVLIEWHCRSCHPGNYACSSRLVR
jgi:RNase H-like domain found in reverse transcriptase/Integrase core domain/Integrase zinc binding domain